MARKCGDEQENFQPALHKLFLKFNSLPQLDSVDASTAKTKVKT